MKVVSLLLGLVLGVLFAVSCSTRQQASLQADVKHAASIVAKIAADGKTAVITGCAEAPSVEVAIGDVMSFLPPGADLKAAELAIISGETAVNALCAKVKAMEAAKPKS